MNAQEKKSSAEVYELPKQKSSNSTHHKEK